MIIINNDALLFYSERTSLKEHTSKRVIRYTRIIVRNKERRHIRIEIKRESFFV